MAKTRTSTGVEANVTASHSGDTARHILKVESDALIHRIEEIRGDESVSSFARRCGIGESLIRKYLAGAQPSAFNLVAMANAGSVTVDWLASGRPPKSRRDLVATQSQSQSQSTEEAEGDSEMLQAVIRVAEHALRRADVSVDVAIRIEEAATAMAAKAQRWPDLAARLEAARAAAALFRITQQASATK